MHLNILSLITSPMFLVPYNNTFTCSAGRDEDILGGELFHLTHRSCYKHHFRGEELKLREVK